MTNNSFRNTMGILSLSAIALTMVACGGSSSSAPAVVNNPPIISVVTTPPLSLLYVNHTYVYSVTATDPEGDAISFTVSPSTGWTVSGTNLIYKPGATSAVSTVTVTATDSKGASATRAFGVPQVAADIAPVAPSAQSVMQVGGAFGATVVALSTTESDGDQTNWALGAGAPTWATLSGSSLTLAPPRTVTPGLVNVPLVATSMYNNATVTTTNLVLPVTVQLNNAAPIFGSVPPTFGKVGQLFTYVMTATDPNADSITYTAPTLPTGAVLNGSTISWTPTLAQQVPTPFLVRATDSFGAFDQQAFTVNVVANGLPTFTSVANATARVGTAYGYTPQVTDPEGDATTITKQTGPGTFSAGSLVWTPVNADIGPVNFQFKVADAYGSTFQNFQVQVNPALLPTFTSTAPSNAKTGIVYTYTPTVSWPNNVGTITMTTAPSGAVFASGAVTWTPTQTQGQSLVPLPMTFTATDAYGAAVQTVNINMSPNTFPVINTPVIPAAIEGHAMSIAFTANDPDSSSLTWSLVSGPGSITSGGFWTFTPDTPDVSQLRTITVDVFDGYTHTQAAFGFTPTADQAPNFIGNFQNLIAGNTTPALGRAGQPKYIGTLVANDGETDLIKYLLNATQTSGDASGVGTWYVGASPFSAPALDATTMLANIPAVVPNPLSTSTTYSSNGNTPLLPNTPLHLWWVAALDSDQYDGFNITASAVDAVGKHDPTGYQVLNIMSSNNRAPHIGTIMAGDTSNWWTNLGVAGGTSVANVVSNNFSGHQHAPATFTAYTLEGLPTMFRYIADPLVVNNGNGIIDIDGAGDYNLTVTTWGTYPTWLTATLNSPITTAGSVQTFSGTADHAAAFGSPYSFGIIVKDVWGKQASADFSLNVGAIIYSNSLRTYYLDGETGPYPKPTVAANTWYIAPISGTTYGTVDLDPSTGPVDWFIGNNAGGASSGNFNFGITPIGIPVGGGWSYLVSKGDPTLPATPTYWFGTMPTPYNAGGNLDLGLQSNYDSRDAGSTLAGLTAATADTTHLRFGLTGIVPSWSAANDTLAVFVPNLQEAAYYGTLGVGVTTGAQNMTTDVSNFMVDSVVTGSNVTLAVSSSVGGSLIGTHNLWVSSGTTTNVDNTSTTDADNAYLVRHTASSFVASGASTTMVFTTAKAWAPVPGQTLTNAVDNNITTNGGAWTGANSVFQLGTPTGTPTVGINVDRNSFQDLLSSLHGVQTNVTFANDTFNVYGVINGTIGPVHGNAGAFSVLRQISGFTDKAATLSTSVSVAAVPASLTPVTEYIYNATIAIPDADLPTASTQSATLPAKMGSYTTGYGFASNLTVPIRPVLNPRFVRGTVGATNPLANPFTVADMTAATTGGGNMTISWVDDVNDAGGNIGAANYSGIKIELIFISALGVAGPVALPAPDFANAGTHNKTFWVAPGVTSLVLKNEVVAGIFPGVYMFRITKVKTGSPTINWDKTPFVMGYPYYFAEAVGVVDFNL